MNEPSLSGPRYESEPWNDVVLTLKAGSPAIAQLAGTFADDQWREFEGYGGPKCLARVIEMERVPNGVRFTLRRKALT